MATGDWSSDVCSSDLKEIADKRKWVMQNYDPYTDGQVCRRMLDAAARYIEDRKSVV